MAFISSPKTPLQVALESVPTLDRVRSAVVEDIPTIVEMGMKFIRTSVYHDLIEGSEEQISRLYYGRDVFHNGRTNRSRYPPHSRRRPQNRPR